MYEVKTSYFQLANYTFEKVHTPRNDDLVKLFVLFSKQNYA